MWITIKKGRDRKKVGNRLIIHEWEKVEKCVVAIVANAFEMAPTTGIRWKEKIYIYVYKSALMVSSGTCWWTGLTVSFPITLCLVTVILGSYSDVSNFSFWASGV